MGQPFAAFNLTYFSSIHGEKRPTKAKSPRINVLSRQLVASFLHLTDEGQG